MKSPTELTKTLGIEVPLICGPMYPCSNPELVAAASEAGALGIVQPLSLSFVHGYDFNEGLRKIRSLTAKPIGMNLLIENSSRIYLERMRRILAQSLAGKSVVRIRSQIRASRPREYFWQAGKNVEGIDKIESVAEIVSRFQRALSA